MIFALAEEWNMRKIWFWALFMFFVCFINNVMRCPQSRHRLPKKHKSAASSANWRIQIWSFTSILIRFKSVETLEEFMTHAAVFPFYRALMVSIFFPPLQSMVWIRSVHGFESPSNYHFKHIPHLFALRVILTVIAMYFQLCTEIPQIQGQCWKPTSNLFTFNSNVPSDHRVRENSGTWRTSLR